MKRTATVLSLAFPVALAACGGGGDATASRGGGALPSTVGADGGPPPPPPPSANVIDIAIWPRMIAAGATKISPASTGELCRRMSLDLTGALPSPDEVAATCAGKTPDQIADAMMATPAFVAREQKLWAENLRENASKVYAIYLVDADALIASLAKGQLAYDDFAARALAHPVLAIERRPTVDLGVDDTTYLTDIATNALRIFLGRSPVGGEAADFANLFRGWTKMTVVDPGLPNAFAFQAMLDPSACADPVYGATACTSLLLGAPTTVALPIPAAVSFESFGGTLPANLEAELEKPGRLLATRAEFWDEAADHAMTRLLGWWKSSRAEPDTDVPEVRSALSSWFRAASGHDLRALYKTIATSILYTSTAEVDPAASSDPPVWAMGPTKAMTAEQWLDSMGKALGRPVGFCDIHTDEPVGGNVYFPDRLRKAQPADFYGFGYDLYYSVGSELGGCTGGIPHAREPGLPSLFGQSDVADAICAAPSVLAPATFDASDMSAANVAALLAFQAQRFLTRDASAEEAAAVTATAACLANQSCDMPKLESQLCGALLRSAAYLYY